MAIITVDQLEEYLGREFTPTEAAQAQVYINVVSAAVQTYTGTTFELQEDVVLRMQADYYGQITLYMKPIQDVSAVVLASNATYPDPSSLVLTDPSYGWDGYDTIFNLSAHVVYDVTLTYGYATAPEDIQGYLLWATSEIVNNPTSLSSFRVGDVTETYGGKTGVTTIASLMNAVLESYKDTAETWRLGPRNYNPTTDFNWTI